MCVRACASICVAAKLWTRGWLVELNCARRVAVKFSIFNKTKIYSQICLGCSHEMRF